jgi:hypothetical protein
MALIILVIAAVVIGYFLARSRYSDTIDETAGKVSTTSRSWADSAGGWVNTRVLRRKTAEPFREWAAGPGAEQLPDDFKQWLESLSDKEATEFIQALDKHSASLGYSLTDLVEGGYDGKPALMQVFVEAIVIYSQEYRKAREVQQAEAEKEEDGEASADEEATSSNNEKKPAEKSTSRRKRGAAETSESAA